MTNQLTTNNTHIANAPEEELKMTNKITCKRCGIEMTYRNHHRSTLLPHIAYIKVKNADGEHLGNIYGGYDDRELTEAWDKITHGACPICDGWNDGIGHACTASGWSVFTPKEAEDVKEEALRDWNRLLENEKIR